jgi:hypothetical protein
VLETAAGYVVLKREIGVDLYWPRPEPGGRTTEDAMRSGVSRAVLVSGTVLLSQTRFGEAGTGGRSHRAATDEAGQPIRA